MQTAPLLSSMDQPRPRRSRVVLTVACVALTVGASLGVAACSTSTPSKSAFVSALETSGIPAKEARCTADAVYRTMSPSEVRQIIDRGASGVPKDDPTSSTDDTDRLTAAVGKCRDAATAVPIGGTTTSTEAVAPTSTGPAFTTTSAPGSTGSTTTTPSGATSPSTATTQPATTTAP